MERKKKTDIQIAMGVSVSAIIINVILSAFKLFAGIFAHSNAMVSDGVESISDIFSTLIVMVGVKMSGKASDEKHPYGHERMECVAAVLLAVIIFATGIGIGYSGVLQIINGINGDLAMPGLLALIAAISTIVIKEGLFWYMRGAAKKINSSALMANAWHNRSDAISSVGSFAGILGARLGLPILDPIASLIICLMILKAAYGIFRDAMRKMMDEACDAATEADIRRVVSSQNGVLGIDSLRTRQFGSRIYVDVEICADGTVPLTLSHRIAEAVHDAIEAAFPTVKHCMVHVNPHIICEDPDEALPASQSSGPPAAQ